MGGPWGLCSGQGRGLAAPHCRGLWGGRGRACGSPSCSGRRTLGPTLQASIRPCPPPPCAPATSQPPPPPPFPSVPGPSRGGAGEPGPEPGPRADSLVPFADYVYFENSSSNPYLIRRIEELNKVACAACLGGGQFPGPLWRLGGCAQGHCWMRPAPSPEPGLHAGILGFRSATCSDHSGFHPRATCPGPGPPPRRAHSHGPLVASLSVWRGSRLDSFKQRAEDAACDHSPRVPAGSLPKSRSRPVCGHPWQVLTSGLGAGSCVGVDSQVQSGISQDWAVSL